MSKTMQERGDAWDAWVAAAAVGPPGRARPVLAGFVHQCGEATLVRDFGAGMLSCSGCRFIIEYPEECQPLYQLELAPAPAEDDDDDETPCAGYVYEPDRPQFCRRCGFREERH